MEDARNRKWEEITPAHKAPEGHRAIQFAKIKDDQIVTLWFGWRDLDEADEPTHFRLIE